MKKGANSGYFGAVKEAIQTSVTGVRLTWRHLSDAVFKARRKPVTANDATYFDQAEGIVTLNYPHEAIPVPDNGRYQLHNEIDDCIVCDKCVKICPVNCIEIDVIKSPEVFGETSDGTPKRLYAATFNIDMAKCCFCGLCTTVCPTECLTMTKEYDFSEFELGKLTYPFANMTEAEIAEKRRIAEEAEKAKAAAKAAKAAEQPAEASQPTAAKPAFKPKFPAAKPAQPATESTAQPAAEPEQPAEKPAAKPVFRPKFKPTQPSDEAPSAPSEPAPENAPEPPAEKPAAKPVFRPKIKPPKKEDGE